MKNFLKIIKYSFLFFIIFLSANLIHAQNNDCVLNSSDVYFKGFPGSITNKGVILVLETSNTCSGRDLRVQLKSIIDGNVIDLSNRDTNYVEVTPQRGKVTYISYKANDEECFSQETPDCRIYTEITDSRGTLIFSSRDILKEIVKKIDKAKSSSEEDDVINAVNFNAGVLLKNCSGLGIGFRCGKDDWKVLENESEIEDILITREFDEKSPCYDDKSQSYKANCYEPLAPLPATGETSIFQTDTETGRRYVNLEDLQIGDYINQIFRIALAILFVIAIIMIIIAGVQYMTVESFYGKSNARNRITNAVVGLLVALGISLILGTINPKLLEVNFTKNILDVSIENKSPFSDDQIIEANQIKEVSYYKASKRELSSNNVNYKLAYNVSDTLKIPNCIAKVILDRESRGGANAIGHDENVTVAGVWSREAFIASGKKYSGTTFNSNPSLLSDKSFKNDDSTIQKNREDLGLDWRFSHGIGLTQTTIFPENFNWKSKEYIAWIKENQEEAWEKRTRYKPFINSLGKSYTPQELLDPQKNLEAGLGHWKGYYQKCGSVQGAFNAYATGSCKKDTTWREAEERTKLYNTCVES